MGRKVTETEDAIIIDHSDDYPQDQATLGDVSVDVGGSDEELHTQEEPPTTDGNLGQESHQHEEYQPNYHYRVLDSEKEIPEDFRSYIKSKDDEERLRDLFTRADSIDHWKDKTGKAEERAATFERQAQDLSGAIESIKNLAKSDFSTLAQLLQIPRDAVMDMARRELEVEDMTESERQRYMEDQQIRAQNFIAQQQLALYQQQQMSQVRQQHEMRMSEALNRPEMQEFAKEFDARMGAGAFKQHCMDYGNMMYQQTRTNIDPLRCVEDTYNKFKNLLPVSQKPAPTSQVNVERQTPMPKVGDRMNVSPSKRRVRSIDDIRKEYQARYG